MTRLSFCFHFRPQNQETGGDKINLTQVMWPYYTCVSVIIELRVTSCALLDSLTRVNMLDDLLLFAAHENERNLDIALYWSSRSCPAFTRERGFYKRCVCACSGWSEPAGPVQQPAAEEPSQQVELWQLPLLGQLRRRDVRRVCASAWRETNTQDHICVIWLTRSYWDEPFYNTS